LTGKRQPIVIYQLFKEQAAFSKRNGIKGDFLFSQMLNFRGDFRGERPNSIGITQLTDHDPGRNPKRSSKLKSVGSLNSGCLSN
jgi:hypothetical protein